MPFTITFEPAAVIKRFSGHVTAAEVRDSMQQPLSHEEFDRLRYCINDFSAIDSHDVSEHDILGFAALCLGARAFNRQIRAAVVTRRLDILVLVKEFAAYEALELATFASLEEARAVFVDGRMT